MIYFIKAFLNHWNVLVFLTGVVLGFMFGLADVVLPILGALEILYVAITGSSKRFRKAIDGMSRTVPEISEKSGIRRLEFGKILASLTYDERNTFERLRKLCLDLRRIAQQVKMDPDFKPIGLSNLQLDGINRLLWIYLKLLYSKNTLDGYFKTIDYNDLESRIKLTQQRLNDLNAGRKETPELLKKKKSLIDTLNTLEQRLENYRLAVDKHEFVQLELERLYAKISGLAEMGINLHESQNISSEIDVIANSMQRTEMTIKQLETVTGISFADKEIPRLMEDY